MGLRGIVPGFQQFVASIGGRPPAYAQQDPLQRKMALGSGLVATAAPIMGLMQNELHRQEALRAAGAKAQADAQESALERESRERVAHINNGDREVPVYAPESQDEWRARVDATGGRDVDAMKQAARSSSMMGFLPGGLAAAAPAVKMAADQKLREAVPVQQQQVGTRWETAAPKRTGKAPDPYAIEQDLMSKFHSGDASQASMILAGKIQQDSIDRAGADKTGKTKPMDFATAQQMAMEQMAQGPARLAARYALPEIVTRMQDPNDPLDARMASRWMLDKVDLGQLSEADLEPYRGILLTAADAAAPPAGEREPPGEDDIVARAGDVDDNDPEVQKIIAEAQAKKASAPSTQAPAVDQSKQPFRPGMGPDMMLAQNAPLSIARVLGLNPAGYMAPGPAPYSAEESKIGKPAFSANVARASPTLQGKDAQGNIAVPGQEQVPLRGPHIAVGPGLSASYQADPNEQAALDALFTKLGAPPGPERQGAALGAALDGSGFKPGLDGAGMIVPREPPAPAPTLGGALRGALSGVNSGAEAGNNAAAQALAFRAPQPPAPPPGGPSLAQAMNVPPMQGAGVPGPWAMKPNLSGDPFVDQLTGAQMVAQPGPWKDPAVFVRASPNVSLSPQAAASWQRILAALPPEQARVLNALAGSKLASARGLTPEAHAQMQAALGGAMGRQDQTTLRQRYEAGPGDYAADPMKGPASHTAGMAIDIPGLYRTPELLALLAQEGWLRDTTRPDGTVELHHFDYRGPR